MVGNPDLEPEKLRTYEVGAIHSFAEFLSGNVNAFITQARDLILIQQSFAGGVMQNKAVNIGEADISGIEIGAKGSVGSSVDLFARYTYMSAEDADGKDLQYVPESKIQAGVAVRPVNWGTAILAVRHVGARGAYDFDGVREVRLDPYTVADVSARGSWGPIALQLTISNFLDEGYEETVGYPMPRRSYLATATWSF
jgi:iron complex outermembrane receptor protein